MSVKKLLILTAAGVASVGMTAAIAGGPHMPPAPVADSYFYIEGNFGYADQDFADTNVNTVSSTIPVESNGGSGGIAYGGDIGYMFNQYWGLEAGWTYLPRFTNLGEATNVNLGWKLYNTQGVWMVAKIVAPVTENVDVFFKAGVSYRYGKLIYTGGAFANDPIRRMEEWRPLLAVGGTYNIGQEWMASLQFMHFMGGTSYGWNNPAGAGTAGAASLVAPASNVLTLGVGYKFMV